MVYPEYLRFLRLILSTAEVDVDKVVKEDAVDAAEEAVDITWTDITMGDGKLLVIDGD